MTGYTVEEMGVILGKIHEANLDAPSDMINLEPEELVKICNGVGGASMSPKLRAALTKAYKCAEATAAIHDYAYENSDGKEASRRNADRDFLNNGLKEVHFLHPNWWDWRRWYGERKICIAFAMLEKLGRADWCIAHCIKHCETKF